MNTEEDPVWNITEEELFARVDSTAAGLSREQAAARLERFGPNTLSSSRDSSNLSIFLGQFRSPISILLIVAALLSAAVGDRINGAIVIGILLVSGCLSYWEEKRADTAISILLKKLENRAMAFRNGAALEVPSAEIVPGDVILLAAGSGIPADARILECKDLFVDESALTGESYPAEKEGTPRSGDAEAGKPRNALFLGTHVISGTGRAVVVGTGKNTVYGKIAADLRHFPPATEFEQGVRRFGYFLLEVAIVLSLVVFAINVGLHRSVLEALLFTLALTVGLTPQLLPAIVTSTLAHGAHRMASKEAIVRRLTAIADLGGINVLCTDKTGTLTEGVMKWDGALDRAGIPNEKVRLFGYLNALHESGFKNPVDDAIRATRLEAAGAFVKLDEVPYDFGRRRLSVLLRRERDNIIITKGAVKEVLEVCSQGEKADGEIATITELQSQILATFDAFSKKGVRCLAVAYRQVEDGHLLRKESESGMVFLGFLTFLDPIKKGAIESVQEIERLGIVCKVITGDNRYVAQKIISDLGIGAERILTGSMLRHLSEKALVHRVKDINLFAEVDPNQKSRIILALKKAGFAVGYLGDGINDASALHDADVGISVDTAVDVTKEAADIVLLRKELDVLVEAIREGRTAFANTLKYVFITTSACFGNMFSMAGISLFASFLPLLPKQILLLNVLGDLPAMAIAADEVDPELINHPRCWDTRRIAWFMATYGLISSVFDYLTFGVLLLLNVPVVIFRTGWFMESLISEILILLVIRTTRPFFRSRTGKGLLAMSMLVSIFALLLPYTGLASLFDMAAVPLQLVAIIALIILAYIAVAEATKWVLPRLLDSQDVGRIMRSPAKIPRAGR